MRLWHYFLGVAFSVIAPWFYYLWFHGPFLARSQMDWGSFGSYMSGVTGPLIGALTLIFLLFSFQHQARAGSTGVFFSLVTAHLDSVATYKTEYSCDEFGTDYLQWLWRNFIDQQQAYSEDVERIANSLSNTAPEILPIIYSFLTVVRFIDEDGNFDHIWKERHVVYFWSRISAVEKKLILAMAVYNEIGDEIRPLMKKYKQATRLTISAPASEEAYLKQLVEQALS